MGMFPYGWGRGMSTGMRGMQQYGQGQAYAGGTPGFDFRGGRPPGGGIPAGRETGGAEPQPDGIMPPGQTLVGGRELAYGSSGGQHEAPPPGGWAQHNQRRLQEGAQSMFGRGAIGTNLQGGWGQDAPSMGQRDGWGGGGMPGYSLGRGGMGPMLGGAMRRGIGGAMGLQSAGQPHGGIAGAMQQEMMPRTPPKGPAMGGIGEQDAFAARYNGDLRNSMTQQLGADTVNRGLNMAESGHSGLGGAQAMREMQAVRGMTPNAWNQPGKFARAGLAAQGMGQEDPSGNWIWSNQGVAGQQY